MLTWLQVLFQCLQCWLMDWLPLLLVVHLEQTRRKQTYKDILKIVIETDIKLQYFNIMYIKYYKLSPSNFYLHCSFWCIFVFLLSLLPLGLLYFFWYWLLCLFGLLNFFWCWLLCLLCYWLFGLLC